MKRVALNPECPICKNTQTRLLYKRNVSKKYFDTPYKISASDYGKHLDIFKCQKCDTIFENIHGLQRAINNHYRMLRDTAYEKERDNRAQAFIRILKKITKIKPQGAFLDIGAATGALLFEARKLGYEASGIEPSPWAAEIARKKFNLNVLTGYIENMKFSPRSFDVITILDVIEHLYDPHQAIKTTSKIIKKGGVLCIVTPNVDSLASKILNEKWWHIRPSHFFYFSPSTLLPLLSDAGFEIRTVDQYKWYLSSAYLLKRLFKLLGVNYTGKLKFLEKITIGITLFDSMEIYAIKK